MFFVKKIFLDSGRFVLILQYFFILVNDFPAKFANPNMKRFMLRLNVYLALIASKKITAETEIRKVV